MSFLWGNTANQTPDQKKFANISNDQINSNQQAVPVKYLAGRNYVAGDYISPAYNPKAVPVKSQTGKGQSTTTGYKYFADFALLFCLGGRKPVDALYTVIVDSDIRWTGTLTRQTGHDSETIQVQDLGTLKIYWGTETQAIDTSLLSVRPAPIGGGNTQDNTTWATAHRSGATTATGANSQTFDAGDPNPYSGHYDRHPAYRGQCYVVFTNWKLGRDRTSVPNIQLELARGCPAPWLAGGVAPYHDEGVNPAAVLYDWLTDTRFGMALPDSFLNLTNSIGGFANLYATLESYGMRISPLITSQDDFRQSIAQLLEYYDGWIRRRGTTIEAGAWAKGTIGAGPTLLDDDLLTEPELEPQGWGPTINEVTVTYKDRMHHFNDYVQVYRDPNNFRITGGPRPQTYSRPWLTDADTAKLYAAQIGAAGALPFTQGQLTVKREWLSNNSLLPGMIFTYNSGFYSTSSLMRILEIEYPADKDAQAKLTVEWERSKWPSLYIPPGFQGPGGFVLGPRAIWQSRITEVPYLLADQKFDTQVITLATRGNVEVQGYHAWISMDGGATYNVFPTQSSTSSFASYGKLTVASGTAGRADFNLFGIDLDLVVSQTPAEMQDDTLLLFCGSEVMSVGTLHVKGGGEFWCNCLRARYGTSAVNHAVNTPVYFLFRDRLRLLNNAGFVPGTAIKIKLQPFTADLDYDLTSITAIDYTIVGFGDVPAPILTPPGGTFMAPMVNVVCNNPPAGFKARFTRDGTPVTGSSQVWFGPHPPPYQAVHIQATTTVRVRFFGDDGRTSKEVIATYTKVTGTLPPPQCSVPSWTYSGTLAHTAGNMILTATTPGSTIHYIKTTLGIAGSETTGAGPLTVALACNVTGDQIEFWATFPGSDDSQHTVIDNTKETTYGGGGHLPPRLPP